MTTTTVDLTPTWASAMTILAIVLEHGTETGKALARHELQRLAQYLDSQQDRTAPMPLTYRGEA